MRNRNVAMSTTLILFSQYLLYHLFSSKNTQLRKSPASSDDWPRDIEEKSRCTRLLHHYIVVENMKMAVVSEQYHPVVSCCLRAMHV